MREDEARTKWCPYKANTVALSIMSMMVGVAGQKESIVSKALEVAAEAIPDGLEKCEASDCMMFQWHEDHAIYLANGLIALIDKYDEPLIRCAKPTWHGRYVKLGDKYLHRVIAAHYYGELKEGLVVDHIDGDSLNNRLGNLRVCTQKDNVANSSSRGGKSIYRGVYQARSGKWVAQISKDGHRTCIGTFVDELEAAKAWDEKASELHGEYAKLNMERIKNGGRTGYCGLAGKP